ncbi:MAG: histidine triad nucleotide-binding protein [Gemmatimonadota bacterium]
MTDCIFCRIAAGEIPAQIVGRSEAALAFRDLKPQAPTHVLVIPLAHLDSAVAAVGDPGRRMLGEVMGLAVETAQALGLNDGGYRLVINTGRDGGQSVGHLHAHLLGGRQMQWPPG